MGYNASTDLAYLAKIEEAIYKAKASFDTKYDNLR